MNNDLISRSALKKALDWIIDNPYVDLDREIMEEIDNAPTVTPDKIQAIMSDYLVYRCEPQGPQGEWIKTEWGYFCDQCGIYAFLDRYEQPIRSDFCPNCGAKMQKGGVE